MKFTKKTLIEYIHYRPIPHELNLSESEITTQDLRQVLNILHDFPVIKSINLNKNNIDGYGIIYFRRNTNLLIVEINQNKLSNLEMLEHHSILLRNYYFALAKQQIPNQFLNSILTKHKDFPEVLTPIIEAYADPTPYFSFLIYLARKQLETYKVLIKNSDRYRENLMWDSYNLTYTRDVPTISYDDTVKINLLIHEYLEESILANDTNTLLNMLVEYQANYTLNLRNIFEVNTWSNRTLLGYLIYPVMILNLLFLVSLNYDFEPMSIFSNLIGNILLLAKQSRRMMFVNQVTEDWTCHISSKNILKQIKQQDACLVNNFKTLLNTTELIPSTETQLLTTNNFTEEALLTAKQIDKQPLIERNYFYIKNNMRYFKNKLTTILENNSLLQDEKSETQIEIIIESPSDEEKKPNPNLFFSNNINEVSKPLLEKNESAFKDFIL